VCRQSRRRKDFDMFGTIICNKKELTKEEQARYQSAYCGLCRTIRDRYGQLERMTINYDMTFLALFLNGLYEEKEESSVIRCPVHMLRSQEIIQNKYIDYAADMTILLSYYKCKDDWEDEKKYTRNLYQQLLEKDMQRIEKEYPRQSTCVKESLQRLNELEKRNVSLVDEVVNCSGEMLSEVFVYTEDFWSNSLRAFGYELGRFIYLMDAAIDYERDKRKHTYNPLFILKQEPKDIEPILIQAIGNATDKFERLPILQDAGIIRNILYGGVWQTYYAKVKGKEEKNGNGSI